MPVPTMIMNRKRSHLSPPTDESFVEEDRRLKEEIARLGGRVKTLGGDLATLPSVKPKVEFGALERWVFMPGERLLDPQFSRLRHRVYVSRAKVEQLRLAVMWLESQHGERSVPMSLAHIGNRRSRKEHTAPRLSR